MRIIAAFLKKIYAIHPISKFFIVSIAGVKKNQVKIVINANIACQGKIKPGKAKKWSFTKKWKHVLY